MKRFKNAAVIFLALTMLFTASCSLTSGSSRSGHRSRRDRDEEEETERTTRTEEETTEEMTSASSEASSETTPKDLTTEASTEETPGIVEFTTEVTTSETIEEGAPVYDGQEYEQAFGSYIVTNDWVEVPSQSMPPDIYTYCAPGNENSATPPNNIVVRHGENYYSREEHETFCTAILQQVTGQAAEYGGTAYLDSYGPVCGNMVYHFVLDCTPYTEQWYIVGDYEFVMIGMSIFDEDEAETDGIRDVADDILWTFAWNED
ncbi:MAG: hypothetical protein J5685_05515 [Clostridiales bacterium]|nr:hypothetical protein [Clostridiales bacterium]